MRSITGRGRDDEGGGIVGLGTGELNERLRTGHMVHEGMANNLNITSFLSRSVSNGNDVSLQDAAGFHEVEWESNAP